MPAPPGRGRQPHFPFQFGRLQFRRIAQLSRGIRGRRGHPRLVRIGDLPVRHERHRAGASATDLSLGRPSTAPLRHVLALAQSRQLPAGNAGAIFDNGPHIKLVRTD